jgi:ABC-type polysaccharide/polyol phosphate transport system ATPase subunit
VSEIAVAVEDVSKRFRLYKEKYTTLKERLIHAGRIPYQDLWALRDVDFEVREGETVGILGRNGSGKSTLLKCICGVLQPSSGRIVVRGKLSGLLELGAGFQPDLSGRENIYMNGSMLGMSKREIDRVFDDIVAFAELEQFIDNQVKFYSSGMYVRLGFAVAVNVDPEILVVDEVLAVGDERFQRKCLDRIESFRDEGRTILFVSHAPEQVRAICDRAVVLHNGRKIGEGEPGDMIGVFRDALLSAGGQLGLDDAEVAPGEALEVAPDGPVSDPGEAAAAPEAGSWRGGVLGGEGSGQGRGAKDVEILGARISQEGKELVQSVVSGRPLTVQLDCRVEKRLEDGVLILEIRDDRGRALLKTDSSDLGVRLDLNPGDHRLSVTFETFPVADGRYTVASGIAKGHRGMLLEWKEGLASFGVIFHGRSAGLLDLPTRIAAETLTDCEVFHVS